MIFACIFPPLAGYIHYNIDPASWNINPGAAKVREADIVNLRSGVLHNTPYEIRGLATFPSFHASTGLLLIWGFYPILSVRYILTLFYIILIVSTPFSGGHYLADIVGGLVMAILAIMFSTYILPHDKKIA